MYWTLRTASLRRVLPLFAGMLITAALMTLLTGFAPLRLLAGTENIENITLENAAGSYVSLDVVKNFDSFALVGGSTDCVAACGDGRVVAVCLPGGMADESTAQMEATYAWMTEQGAEPSSGFTVSGELCELKGEELDAYFRWLSGNTNRLLKAGAVESANYNDYALPYVLRVNMLGGVDMWMAYAVTVIVLLLTAAALALILMACFGAFQLEAGLYVRRNKKALKLRSVQSDFEMGGHFGDVHIGQTFTWFFEGPRTVCVKNSDIVWAYTGKRGKKAMMEIYMLDGKRYDLSPGGRHSCEGCLQALKKSECRAVTGYSKETARQFKLWLADRLSRREEKQNDEL